MAVAWSGDLPQCPASWAEQPDPDVIRTEMDIGEDKVRRRSTLLNQKVQVMFYLEPTQYDYFKFFYETTCQMGVIDFTFIHPITGSLDSYSFLQPPSYQFVAGKKGVGMVQVSMQWELRP